MLCIIGAVLLCLAALPGASAQEISGIKTGAPVVCNTEAEAKDFVEHRNSGLDVPSAIVAVNVSSKDPTGCGQAALAYRIGKIVGTKAISGRLNEIAHITIIAAFDGEHWIGGPPLHQVAVIELDGDSI